MEKLAKIAMYVLIPGVAVAVVVALLYLAIAHRDITSGKAALSFGGGCLLGGLLGLKNKFA